MALRVWREPKLQERGEEKPPKKRRLPKRETPHFDLRVTAKPPAQKPYRATDPAETAGGLKKGLFLFVALLGCLNVNADVLRYALDVLENLASARTGGFVSAFELLEFFFQIGDLSFEGLNVVHGDSFLRGD
jgi:hypothetical protein